MIGVNQDSATKEVNQVVNFAQLNALRGIDQGVGYPMRWWIDRTI